MKIGWRSQRARRRRWIVARSRAGTGGRRGRLAQQPGLAEEAARWRPGTGGAEPVLLEITGLSKVFELTKGRLFKRRLGTIRALDGLDLSLRRGEVVGLIGESGAGKSTLVRCLMGHTTPSAGQIRWAGSSADPGRGAGGGIHAILQDPFAAFPAGRTGIELIGEPLLRAGADAAGLDRQIDPLLERCGLSRQDGERSLGELSGGQRQRIGIARALAGRPELLVCDDAVSALDAAIKAQIIELLAELRRDYRLTFLFLGHDLAPVQHLCDRLGVLYAGKLVEIGPPQAVLRTPRHPYSQLWLGSPDDALGEDDEAGPTPLAGPGRPAAPRPAAGCVYQPSCPRADAGCRSMPPPLRFVATGHAVACLRAEA